MITLSKEDFDLLAFQFRDTFRYVSETLATTLIQVDSTEAFYHIEIDTVGNKILWRKLEWEAYKLRIANLPVSKKKLGDPILDMMYEKLRTATDDSSKNKMKMMIDAYESGEI